jgi:hypothetical protein
MKIVIRKGADSSKGTTERTVLWSEAFQTMALVLDLDATARITCLEPDCVSISRRNGSAGTEFRGERRETQGFRQFGAIVGKVGGNSILADGVQSPEQRDELLQRLALPDMAWGLLRDLSPDRSYLIRAGTAFVAVAQQRARLLSTRHIEEAIHFNLEGFLHSIDGWITGKLAPNRACATQ